MGERALSFDDEEVAACASSTNRVHRAGSVVGNDAVDDDTPVGDGDAGLAGRDDSGVKAAFPRRVANFERCGHLPRRAVGPDGRDDCRVHVAGGPRCHGQVFGRLAQVVQFSAVFRGEAGELIVVSQEVVQSRIHVTAAFERRADILRQDSSNSPPMARCR